MKNRTLTRKKGGRDDPSLWIGTLELRKLPGSDYLKGAVGAFVNLVTWARDSAEFRDKAGVLADGFDLFVVGIEREGPVANRSGINDEIAEMIRRAETNPRAAIYGTFYTYRLDEA
jgi:hypothetical protein